jgi:hypothetical protein
MDVLSARLRTWLLLAVALPAARMRVGVPPTAHGVARTPPPQPGCVMWLRDGRTDQ